MDRNFFTIEMDPNFTRRRRRLTRYLGVPQEDLSEYRWMTKARSRVVKIDSLNIVTMGVIHSEKIIALTSQSIYEKVYATYFREEDPERIHEIPTKILKMDVTTFLHANTNKMDDLKFGVIPSVDEGLVLINSMTIPRRIAVVDTFSLTAEETLVFYQKNIDCNHPFHGNQVYDLDGNFLGLAMGTLISKPDGGKTLPSKPRFVVLSSITISQILYGEKEDDICGTAENIERYSMAGAGA